MTQTAVLHSGYLSIFNSKTMPADNSLTPTVYLVSSVYNSKLAIVPLEPGFYKGVIDFLILNPIREIYFIVPDISVVFISEYFRCYDYITNVLRRNCKLFSRYRPPMDLPSDFEDAFIYNDTGVFALPVNTSGLDVYGTMTFTLTSVCVQTWTRYTQDVVLDDTISTKYLVSEMNDDKANHLINNLDRFDELHIPYICGIYPNRLPYSQMIGKYDKLINKAVVSRFGTYNELNLARSKNVPIGKEYNRDFIQT